MLFGERVHPKHFNFFQGRDELENQKKTIGRFISKPAKLSLMAMQPA